MIRRRSGGIRRAGFVSTRISGLDGVSLEIDKWARILEGMGLECYYLAGESDRPETHTRILDHAHFNHPVIQDIQQRAFNTFVRDADLAADIREVSGLLARQLRKAIRSLQLDLLIAENCLTIPMNIPLGIALVQVIRESGIACIAHHHDFAWERDRYLVNSVDEFMRQAFPPRLPEIINVAINSLSAAEFGRRTGLPCRVVPNVMNFSEQPEPPDEEALEFRKALGIDEEDILIVQPTRVVSRKGIEHAIELVRRLESPRTRLVITHAVGDESSAYARRVADFGALLGVEVLFAGDMVSTRRDTTPDGRKRFALQDVYRQADLATYPSAYEGFGNAFLEAVYFKLPVLCNRYPIFRVDIEPCGFRPIMMDGFLTQDVIDHVVRVLTDGEYRQQMVEHNYEVARRFFSYEVVAKDLKLIISGILGSS